MGAFLTRVADVLLRRRWLYRSSITGRYVSRAFAEANPETTYRVRAR